MANYKESKIYEFGTFRLDVGKRLLHGVNGEPFPLMPKAFDTLYFLVANAGRLIEKDEMMSAVWPDTVVEENNLNKNISVLRRVLGENIGDHRFIVTVPGTGYKFVAEVREITTESQVGLLEETFKQNDPKSPASDLGISDRRPVSNIKLRANRKASRFWLVSIAATVLVGLSFLGFYSPSEPSVNAPITSVAVLPFVNADGNSELDYLSDGLSENLIDRLSELSQLKVIARSSSFKYRDEKADLMDVAQKLGVQSIITGRVTRRGDDLIIRVELIDTRDNKQLWGGQFNRKEADALSIEGEIARTVSRKLRINLSGEQEQQLTKRGTDNPEAHELVLRGDLFFQKSATLTKALEYYSQAVSLDPNYALAYARIAATYQILGGNSIVDPKDVLPEIRTAAKKAIELDKNLADAHYVLAELARDKWDWKMAEYEYQRALELNPNLVSAHRRYSSYLSNMGRHEQAIAEAERSRELDPQQLSSHGAFFTALLVARRYDESIAGIRKILEMQQVFGTYGSFALLGNAYAGKGNYGEAITAYKEAIRLGSKQKYHLICLGAAYAEAGQREKARAILKQLETKREYVSPGELPILYAALGEREKAFATLEKAYAARDLQLQHLNADPGFDILRADPRFKDLVRRVGLPQ